MASRAATPTIDKQPTEELFARLKAAEGDRSKTVAELTARLAGQPRDIEHRLRKVQNLIESPHFDQALTELIAAVDGTDVATARPPADEVAEATRDELYEMAKEADISGRSRMTKDELSKALRQQE